MCEPISIIAGVASAAGGMMQAQAQHNAQQAAVNRQNQMAQQQYQQELQIQKEKSRSQAEEHKAKLAAHAQAQNDYLKQQSINQSEANRAMAAVSAKKQEKQAKAAFEMEAQVTKAIQAQGQLLSTGATGASFMLQTEQAQRELGFATAQIEQNMYDANKVFVLEHDGVLMDQYSRDAQAYNNLPAAPQGKRAPFLPYKPILAAGPSKGALMGAMVGAVGSGVGAGVQSSSAISQSKWGSKWYKS